MVYSGILFIAVVLVVSVRYLKESWYRFVKPFPMVLIFGFYLVHFQNVPHYYLLGLGFLSGLAGDLLLLNEKRFIHGLGAFLLGHLFYIITFSISVNWLRPEYNLLIFLVILCSAYAALLYRHLRHAGRDKYIVPVFIYMAVLASMIFTASMAGLESTGFNLVIRGAILFGLSDIVLSFNKFIQPFRAAQGIILVTYYSGQALIIAEFALR